MKNKKVIKAFETINITEEKKKKILENILKEQKKEFTPFPKMLIYSFSALLIFFINIYFYSNPSTIILKGKNKSFQENQVFIYNNKCYKEQNKIIVYVIGEENNANKIMLSLKDYKYNIRLNKNYDYSTYSEINCLKELKG